MKNKSLKNNIENSTREKVTRFSIRKVSFGAASVAVSALFMALGQGAASAAETNTATEANVTNAATDNNTTAQDNKKEEVAAPVATTTTPTTPTTAEKAADKINEKLATEANVAEKKKEQTTSKAQEISNTTAETTKSAEVTAATTESNKPKSRKRRAAEPSSTTTDTTSDEAANQVYTAPRANAGLDELKEKLEQLPSAIQNNTKINNMDGVGATTGVEAGEVREIKEFGGWKAVRQDDGSEGKFAIARKTEKGVFPAYTININRTDQIWFREQVLDGDSNYTLLLSKVVTKPSSTTDVPYDGKPYVANNESGNQTARTAKGFDGIEKIFKVYSPEKGSKVKVSFKVGYTGDVYGSKAKYKVEVFADDNTSPVYTAEFDPAVGVTTDEMTVVAAKDGTSKNEKIFVTRQSKEEIENKMALDENRPNGKVGSFTSKEIELSPGVTSYKVRISLANKRYGGMSYNSNYLQYSLPISGLNFNISQNTNVVAKDLLTKIYAKLKETVVEDEKGMTTDSKAAYDAELEKVKTLVEAADLTTTDNYKTALTAVLQKQKELTVDKTALTAARGELDNLITTVSTDGKVENSITEYNKVKAEAQDVINEAKRVIDSDASTVEEVELAVAKVKQKTAELNAAKVALVDKATEPQKEALAKVDEELKAADTAGKTPESVDAYNKAVEKLQAELEEAKAKAKEVAGKGDNATELEAFRAQAKVAEVKAKLAEAAALLKDKANKDALEKAKAAVDTALAEKAKAIEANDKLSDAEKAAAKEEAKKAADEAKKAIAEAKDQAGVDAKVAEGKAAVEAVNPVGKEKAKAAVDAALAEKAKAIEANDKLSDAEKAAAKDEAKKAADEAKKAIAEAKDQAGVDAKVAEGKAAVAVNPVGKDKAKEEVEAELAKKLAELENATDLTDAEKAAAKAKVAEEAKKAIEAIGKAMTQAEVDQVIRNFVYRTSAVVLEKEEYDLSKLFVNGSVIVKQGEALADKDILSKLNLPEGVEVVKVEKPETVALGKGTAKVTLKLADGTQVTITVPVEVVEGSTTSGITKLSSEGVKTGETEESSNKVSNKQLPNTGTTETNTGLVGLGLGILGLLAAARRRKEK